MLIFVTFTRFFVNVPLVCVCFKFAHINNVSMFFFLHLKEGKRTAAVSKMYDASKYFLPTLGF